MRSIVPLPTRAIALSQALLLCLPLAALDHYHHPSGHDEMVEHVEADHGTHHSVTTEPAPRVSTAPVGPFMPGPTSVAVQLPSPPIIVAARSAASAEIRFARPPPDATLSRAPPVFS